MKLTRAASLVVVVVLTVGALQAAVAAYDPEGIDPLVDGSRVWIDPPSLSVEEGETFTVTAMVENAQDMVGYRLKMDWESSVLTVTNVTDAGFLLEAPSTSLNMSAGSFNFEVWVWPPPYEDGADGDGALAVMTLRAVGSGVSPLNLDGTKVEWYDAASPWTPQVPSVDDGRVTVGLDFVVYLPLTVRGYGP